MWWRFVAKKVKKIATKESLFMDDKFEGLSQIQVLIKDVLDQVNKMNSQKSPWSCEWLGEYALRGATKRTGIV